MGGDEFVRGCVAQNARARLCSGIEVGVVPDPNHIAPLASSYSQRGRDRAKLDIRWRDPEVLFVNGDHRVVRMRTKADCSLFGYLMGHCAGSHWKTHIGKNPPDWHFLSLLTPDDVPHVTIHAKEKSKYQVPEIYGSAPVKTWPDIVNIVGQECFIVAAYTKGYGTDIKSTKYGKTIEGWYKESLVPGAEKLTPKPSYW